jgi:hypothetical protein
MLICKFKLVISYFCLSNFKAFLFFKMLDIFCLLKQSSQILCFNDYPVFIQILYLVLWYKWQLRAIPQTSNAFHLGLFSDIQVL